MASQCLWSTPPHPRLLLIWSLEEVGLPLNSAAPAEYHRLLPIHCRRSFLTVWEADAWPECQCGLSRLQTDFFQGCPYLKRARELYHVHFYNVLVPVPRTTKPPPRGPQYQHSRVPLDFPVRWASSLTSPSEQWQKTKGRWNPKGRGCEPDTSSPRVLE